MTDLRKKIRKHELSPGEQLSSQTALAEHYKISVPTVRQTLGVLEGGGLIDSVQGIGADVRAPRKRLRRTMDRYQWENQWQLCRKN
jgi:GntR family transcriptional regulator